MKLLSGKRVLITGASAGIGKATAHRFAEEGAVLILVARQTEKLNMLKQVLADTHHAKVEVITADIRDFSVLTDAIKPFLPVDILVNNAGLARGTEKYYELPFDEIDEVMDTNLRALMKLTRYILPSMIENRSGHIINLGSIAGHEAYPGGNVYNTSKFAVRGFTQALRMDLVSTPIRVTSIDPGMVETEFSITRFRGDKTKAANVYKGIEALMAEDIADAILYAATRRKGTNINEIVIMPVNQASALVVHKDL